MKKTMVRILAAAMAVLLIAGVPTLFGCSSSASESYDMAVMDEMPVVEESYDMALNGSYSYGSDVDSEEAVDSAPAEESGEFERKIIRDANIEIEAEDAKACYASVLQYVKSLGGYESSFNERSNEYSSGTYVDIDAEFRLPPEKLDEFVGHTGDFGEVTYCSVTSEEITETYYDLATRLETKERALDSYYELLEKAETIEDILIIQKRIDDLTVEIESIKGRLRLYDSLVDESTVYLSISQYTAAPVAEKEFEWDSLTAGDFFKLIKNGFLGVCNFVWSAFQWLLIIVISSLPILLIAGAVFFVVRKVRKNAADRKPQTAKPADNGDNVASPPDYQ